MAISFFAIAAAANSEWYEERFSGLYLDETLAGRREVSVLFADLTGFTPFTEARGPEQVHAMLVTYFGELAPMIDREFDGEVQDFVGDQIFADLQQARRPARPRAARRPRRARAAARAAERSAPSTPSGRASAPASTPARCWPASSGDRGHRIHGVFGDTVNLGARLEGKAPPGGVVIGARPRGAARGRTSTALAELQVKGKSQPVAAYVLRALS